MKVVLEINNETGFKVKRLIFEKAAREVLKTARGPSKSLISLALVNKAKARTLNKRYLKRSYVPEVLSFTWQDELGEKTKKSLAGRPKETFLGEILICPSDIKARLSENGEDLMRRVIFLFIHGLLHLLGYNHSKRAGADKSTLKMEKTEEEIMRSLFKKY